MVEHADFTATFRRGVRSATSRIVVHAQADKSLDESVLVGFVVPKKQVAQATKRNRVKRQLRHLMREHLPHIPAGTRVVIRAQAPAATASYHLLDKDVRHCLPQALRRAQAKADLAQSTEDVPSRITTEQPASPSTEVGKEQKVRSL